MNQAADPGKKFRYWNKELHLYIGLFLGPFILIYCISTVLLNHTWLPWESSAGTQSRQIEIRLEPSGNDNNLFLAQEVMRQAGVAGEIRYINRQKNKLVFPVARPRETVNFEVDLAGGTAKIEAAGKTVWDALIYLHRSPGPHGAAIRGNWVFTVVWKTLTNTLVCLLIFMTAGGVFLWALVKSGRKTGLSLLGAGCLFFLLLLVLLL